MPKKQKKNPSDIKCWKGYERVPGKKAGEPGSCKKKKSK